MRHSLEKSPYDVRHLLVRGNPEATAQTEKEFWPLFKSYSKRMKTGNKIYWVVYNSEEHFEICAWKSRTRQGRKRAAAQQKRGFFHALPDSEIYTTEYLGGRVLCSSSPRWCRFHIWRHAPNQFSDNLSTDERGKTGPQFAACSNLSWGASIYGVHKILGFVYPLLSSPSLSAKYIYFCPQLWGMIFLCGRHIWRPPERKEEERKGGSLISSGN